MTVRHIVTWKLAAEDAETRASHAAEAAARLNALKGVVPSIIDIHVGTDIVGGANWDLALVADFADVDALQAYIVHPDHEEAAAFVRSIVSDRSAVDVEV